MPHWVNLGHPQSLPDNKHEIAVRFSTTGIRDLAELSATAIITGTAQDASRSGLTNAAQDNIKIFATVKSTPSLDKSTLKLSKEVAEGNPVTLSIEAFDEENLPIAQNAGRFIVVKLRHPNGNEVTKAVRFQASTKCFALNFGSNELSEPGAYHLWVHEVFGFPVKVENRPFSLPTEGFPRTLTVVPSTQANQQLIMGVVMGTALGLCIGLMIFYILRNPRKAKKVLVSFLCVEVLISVRIGFDGFDFYTESSSQTDSFCIWIRQSACIIMQNWSMCAYHLYFRTLYLVYAF